MDQDGGQMKLSIIVPTYNEQRTIRELIGSVDSVRYPVDHEIIIVDDASTDRTYEKEMLIRLKNEKRNIRIFRNHMNKGKGFSIRKGIRRATGDFIVVQDADNEYDPRDIPTLIEPILNGRADVVYGSRFLGCLYPKGMAFPNWLANKILTKITNFLFGLKLTDMETCYKVFRAEVLKTLPLKANRFSFEPEVTALIAKRKIAIMELPVCYNGRTAKKGKKIKARDFIFALLTLVKYKTFFTSRYNCC